MFDQQELAEHAQARWALGAVENVCGLAARRLVAQQLSRATLAQKNTLTQVLTDSASDLQRAYLIMEVLARPNYVRTLWPHMNLTERDVRNKLRQLCPDFTNAEVSGWGYRNTYNPSVPHGEAFPMLVHGFGAQKEVASDDAGWADYVIGEGSAPNRVIAKPVLRSLSNPATISSLVLSCSLLSGAKCSTASPLGWIINAPVWNIFGFAPRDIQFPNDNARTMNGIAQAQGIAKGQNNMALKHAWQSYANLAQVITQTQGTGGESHYNEIVVLGTSRLFNTTTTVTGIFIKVCVHQGHQYLVDAIDPELYDIPGLGDVMGFYSDNRIIDAINLCARTYNLPIVPVVDDKLQGLRTGHRFDVVFNGLTIRNNWNCALA